MKAGWQTTTLGEVLAVLRNGVNCKQRKEGRGDRISRIESIWDACFDISRVGYAELSARDKERYRLQPNDILFSHINSAVHVGKTAVFNCTEPVYHGVNLLLMRPKDIMVPAYLEHALRYLFESGYWRGVCKQSVNQASVNQQDISRVEISYPKSLSEQQHIVAILDEAFEGIAIAKANAEKNLQSARAILESHLKCAFVPHGEGWIEKRLDELCAFSSGGTPSKQNAAYWKGNIPWISGRDMKSTRLSGSHLHISKAAVDESATRMAPPGTLLILVRGMGLAHGAQIGELMVPSAFNQDIRGIHPNSQMLPRYLLFAIRDRINSSDTVLSNAAHGTLKIDSNELRKVRIPFPPREQQERIVGSIDALAEETKSLADVYVRKLAALVELKKSLLHSALSGELRAGETLELIEAVA